VQWVRLVGGLGWPAVVTSFGGGRTERLLFGQFGPCRSDPLVKRVGATLAAKAGVRGSFSVLEGDMTNAVALPNGHIILWKGLLKQIRHDEDMVAGVLAHEIGHLQHDHFLQRIQIAAFARFVLGIFGGSFFRRMLQSTAATGITRGVSRAHETQADEAAIALMRKADYNPVGFIKLLSLLTKTHPTTSQLGSLFGTHPDPVARIQHIRLQLQMHGTPIPNNVISAPPQASPQDNIIRFPGRR